MVELTQWEYHIETFGSIWSSPKDEDLEQLLDELGEEGWEVCAIFQRQNSSKITITARRPLRRPARRSRDWPSE